METSKITLVGVIAWSPEGNRSSSCQVDLADELCDTVEKTVGLLRQDAIQLYENSFGHLSALHKLIKVVITFEPPTLHEYTVIADLPNGPPEKPVTVEVSEIDTPHPIKPEAGD
jgi:hypothetical protein